MIPHEIYLYHHGVLGQKWGVRRYQPYPEGEKKGKEVGEAATRRRKKKTLSDEELKKKKSEIDEKKAKEEYEAAKQKALKSGTPEDVYKFKGNLTRQEMEEVVRRFDLEDRIASKIPREKTSMEKMDAVMKDVKKLDEWSRIGLDAYRTFASVYNSTKKGKNKPLIVPNISSGKKKKK